PPSKLMASLLRHFYFVTGAIVPAARAPSWTLVTARTVIAVIAVATPVAAAFISVSVAIDLPHHRRRSGFHVGHTHRQGTQHIFVDVLLALHFADRCGRRIDVEQGEMGLAVLADTVCQGLDTPVFHLGDRAAHLLDDALVVVRQFVHLLLRQVLPR